MKKMKLLSVFILAAVVLAACAGGQTTEAVIEEPVVEAQSQAVSEEPSTAEEQPAEEFPVEEAMDEKEISYSADVFPILEQFASDHFDGKAGVFLQTYEDAMEYVVPGNPEESVLYKVLIGDGVPLMPPEGKLPDEMIQIIYLWIQQGAKNN